MFHPQRANANADKSDHTDVADDSSAYSSDTESDTGT